MAVVLAFRLAIVLAPGAVRVARWAEGPGVANLEGLPHSLVRRLHDPGESDADLTDALSAATGTVSDVATFTEPFELRRFQVEFTRQSGFVGGEDVAVITFHCIKAPGGTPTDNWLAADFDAFTNNLTTWWNGIKEWYGNEVSLERIKAYRAGPDVSPPQVPVYDNTAITLPGTSTGSHLPPQIALTVTERAGSKLHWGRIYLPAPSVNAVQGNTSTDLGRVSTPFMTDVADTTDTFYTALAAAAIPVVVYRQPLPARQNAAGETLPARDGSAWTVETVQVDDLWDTMRSRRFDQPLLRLQRGI